VTETIPAYLNRAWLRDLAKGGSGWRTTREVADNCSIPINEARTRLTNDWSAGLIASAYEGRFIVWRALLTPEIEAEIARLASLGEAA